MKKEFLLLNSIKSNKYNDLLIHLRDMKKIRGKEVIFEYVNFGETLPNDDLASLRSNKKQPITELLYPGEYLILDFKKNPGKHKLIYIISSNLDNSKNYIDLCPIREEYDKNNSLAEAYSENMGCFFYTEVNECHTVFAPDLPLVRRKFVEYQKGLRNLKKELDEMAARNEFVPLNYNYGNSDSLDKMTKNQIENRESMLQLKLEKSEEFNLIWIKGEYHLATIVARLEQTDIPETILMREEILKKNSISVDIKDYGLTVQEILTGLQIANKSLEKYLYKAFAEANSNLKAMILIIKNNDVIAPEDKFLAMQTIQVLSADPLMKNKEDLDKYNKIKKIVKKYNLPTHKNWKAE